MKRYYGTKCPWKFKYQLVEFFCKRYPDDPQSKYMDMKPKQLYAMWYSIANRDWNPEG